MSEKKKKPTSQPAEHAAAMELHTAFEAFNAKAGSRVAITKPDQEALQSIAVLMEKYERAALEAWSNVHVRGFLKESVPEIVARIKAAISAYAATCQGMVSLNITANESDEYSGTSRRKVDAIEAPAIESGAVRAHLVAKGNDILQMIGTAIEAGRARDIRAEQAEHEYRDAVKFWLAHPITGPLMTAFLAIVDTEEALGIEGIGNAIGAWGFHLQKEGAAGRREVTPEPIYSLEWRKWVPIAREIAAPAPQQLSTVQNEAAS